MKETRYFVKDIVNTERPLMGKYGVYCTTAELSREYGMSTEDEAWSLCEALWKDDCPYFNGDYEIIEREVEMDPAETAKLYAALDAYIAEHYTPAAQAPAPAEAGRDAELAEQMRLFEEAQDGLTIYPFEDFKKEAEQCGGFDPEDKDWYSEVVALWAVGKIPVIWAYCREWSDGAVVFTDVEPYYSGIDGTCEILSKDFVDFGEHCARVNFY